MSNTNIMIIPNDIVIEIFSRIPAKSLLRLRWACKYLFDLITRDGAFIKKNYLHHQTTSATNSSYDDNDDDDRILSNTSLLHFYQNSPVVYTMNLRDIVNNDHDGGTFVNMDCYNLPFSILDKDDYLHFCGSCNGLILLHLYSKKLHMYFLWNPCTKEFKELPHEPISSIYPASKYNYRVLGFGYDHTIDDYKVMRIIFSVMSMEIGVYTLGLNSWSTKIVTDPLLTAYLEKEIYELGVLVNGALHWVMVMRRGIGTITSFDITKEEIGEIEGPYKEELIEIEFERPINYVVEPDIRLILSVLNGCLCMCQMPHFKENYVIWMMKDYGVKDSWTKLFTINMEKVLAAPARYDDPRDDLYSFEQYYKDGGILMVFKGCETDIIIVACDSKKNDKPRFIYSRNRDRAEDWLVNGTYIESLVSLNSGMYLILAAGSRKQIFRKQDLLEYEVRAEKYIGEKYLVRKGQKDEDTDNEDEDFEEDGN